MRWQQFRPDSALSKRVAQNLDISPITAQVLINRGMHTEAKAGYFLEPKLSNLTDPRNMPDAIKAAKRVLLAKERGEKIFVYGDYDVDGVTGTAILVETLNFLGVDPTYYIPHRYDEGYGLNNEAIKEIKASGGDLIVTVDCGVSNDEEIKFARSLGLEVIVTDHHNPPKKLPDAYATVNPKLGKRDDPARELSGAGVAFKFAWALLREAGIQESGMLLSLLDLTCLGTIADVVPLVDENRILASQGLASVSSRRRLGLRALLEAANINGRVGTREVNFGLAPRINAAGRLEHASYAIDLLLSKDENAARALAEKLNKINVKRQGIGSDIQEEVFLALKTRPADGTLIILDGKGWHPGVIGIVASQVVDQFYRPAVLISVTDGVGRGSARSVDGFNIFELLQTCKDLFIDFGGHEFAAGFEIDSKDIEELKGRLKSESSKRIRPEDLEPRLQIDCEIEGRDISLGLVNGLEALSPFGKGNSEPVFMTRGLRLTESRRVGDGSHLKAKFTDGRVTLETIGFGLGGAFPNLNYSSSYDIAYELRSSQWNGYESAELRLIDLKEAGK